MYELSRTVRAHSNDVRAVTFANDTDVVSTSRDGSCVLTSGSGGASSTPLIEGTTFLNSVAFDKTAQTVFVGAQDSAITAVQLDTLERTFYIGHSANVCCLDVASAAGRSLLASGSWDHSVRIWESPTSSFELSGHTQNVWAVRFVAAAGSSSADSSADSQMPDRLLSASADKTIKLWDLSTRKCIKTYTGHSDVVRALAVLPVPGGGAPQQFVSSSNDGTLRFWSLTGGSLPQRTLEGHTSFVYSVSVTPDGKRLISASEDHTVRVWDAVSGECVQHIAMPSISQWCVACNPANGDFVVGSSDSTARVFTQSDARLAPDSEIASFHEEAAAMSTSGPTIDEDSIRSASHLEKPGKEGETAIVRVGNQLEAHSYSNGTWTRLGEVVGSTAGSKTAYEGKEYDHVFDVDVIDGQPPLKLPFNDSDNPYSAAEAFVMRYELPSSYLQQIVQFLIANSTPPKASSASASSTSSSAVAASASAASASAAAAPEPSSSAAPAAAGASSPQSQSRPQAVPVHISSTYQSPAYTTLLPLKSFQRDGLLRALGAADTSKYSIDELLSALPSSGSELLRAALALSTAHRSELPALLPVYDLLRVAIADAAAFNEQEVWVVLLGALDASIPKHCLLSIRGINNLCARADFDPAKPATQTMLAQALEMIEGVCGAAPGSAKPLALALATLTLNLAVRQISYVDYNALLAAVGPVVAAHGDDEALYRFALATSLRLSAAGSVRADFAWFGRGQQPRLTGLLAAMQKGVTEK